MLAMAGPLGITELVVIGGIILIFFGVNRLPEMGRSLGQGLWEFRRSPSSTSDEEPEKNDPVGPEDLAQLRRAHGGGNE